MTTLASAVSIGDNQLLIDAPMSAGQIPGWVKIDDELLNVGGQHFRTGTTLVLTDPATAAHSQGATVTYAGRPYNAAFLAATAGEGGVGGAIAVDNTVDPPFDASTFVAPGATESAPGEATLPLGSILTDPGALWEAEHEYVTGDRILVWDTVVFEAQDDGLSGAIEPEWDIVVAIGDGDISAWTPLGELGELNNGLMPLGLGQFALTSPSNLGVPLTDHEAVTTTIHGIPDTADLATTSDVTGAVVDHAALQGAHHILSGAADPSAGGGVAASSGDIYVRTNAQIWMKFGPTDTEWRCVIDPTAFWLDSSGDVMTNALFPTADPAVIGKLWADAGTLKVSAG